MARAKELSEEEKEQTQRIIYKEVFPFARLLGLIWGVQVWYERDYCQIYFQAVRLDGPNMIVTTTIIG